MNFTYYIHDPALPVGMLFKEQTAAVEYATRHVLSQCTDTGRDKLHEMLVEASNGSLVDGRPARVAFWDQDLERDDISYISEVTIDVIPHYQSVEQYASRVRQNEAAQSNSKRLGYGNIINRGLGYTIDVMANGRITPYYLSMRKDTNKWRLMKGWITTGAKLIGAVQPTESLEECKRQVASYLYIKYRWTE